MKKDTYNEITTQALEEEQKRLSEQYQMITDELNKRKQEEETRRLSELKAEKKQREEEIREAKKQYDELVQAFLDDYGHYHDESFWSWFARL